jgi:hypothetical protein
LEKHLKFVVQKESKIMKKIALLISAIALSFSATFAQTEFQLGLNISPNFNWFKAQTETVENDGLKFGFNYGIIGDFNISDNYSFSTGVSIVNTGGTIKYADVKNVGVNSATEGGVSTADMKLKYVEIPLTLKLKTNEIGYLTYFGQFGFGLGVNYDAEADIDFDYPGSNGSVTFEDEDFNNEINLIRASLIVGLGAEYNLSGNTSLVLGITFNNGFTNVLSKDAYEENLNGDGKITSSRSEEFKAINNFLLINVGVLF